MSIKRNIIFEMTNNCNYKCAYCFEKDSDERKAMYIDYDTINNTLNNLITEAKEEYMITFFGGEPLLCFDKVKYIVSVGGKIAREKSCYISFNIITNGSLCTKEVNDFLVANNIYTFFSFDGNEDIQNKYRISKKGENTFLSVIGNIQEFLKLGKSTLSADNMAVRITVTKDLISSLDETYLYLRDIIKCPKVTFALVSATEDTDYALKNADLDVIEKVYNKLARIYIDEIREGKSVNRFFESIVRNIIYGIHKTKFCDCGEKYIAIGANGNIYPCEGFLGYKEFCSSNINNDDQIEAENNLFYIEDSRVNSDCVKCWAKNLCAGSCYHECYMRHGDINTKDEFMCETYRIAIKNGIFVYNQLLNESLIEQFKNISIEKIPDVSFPVLDKENAFFDVENKTLFYSNIDNYINMNLDELACDILTLCNGNNSMFNISSTIASLYDVEKETAYNDINELLLPMKQDGIIYLTN